MLYANALNIQGKLTIKFSKEIYTFILIYTSETLPKAIKPVKTKYRLY